MFDDAPIGDRSRQVSSTFLRELIVHVINSPNLYKIEFSGAWITGSLKMDNIKAPVAIKINNSLFEQQPNLNNAEVDNLNFDGCRMPGITARGLKCKGDFRMAEGFTCTEMMDITSANISGNLFMGRSTIYSGENPSIRGSWMRVGGQFNAPGIKTQGRVNFVGTRVGGTMSFWGARLGATKGVSFDGERLSVGESLFMKEDFSSVGVVVLTNAVIDGGLDMTGACLGRGLNRKRSLSAGRIHVKRNVSLRKCIADGSINLSAASVGGSVSFLDSKIRGTDLDFSVNLSDARASRLNFKFALPPMSPLNLTGCTVESFIESKDVWPPAVMQENFSYKIFTSVQPKSVVDALDWIRLHPNAPLFQAYDSLINVYKNMGLMYEARKITVARERARTSAQPIRYRTFGYIFDILVGYGYHPLRALFWIVALTFIGGVFFNHRHPNKLDTAPAGMEFHSYAFALDTILPSFINLRQEQFFLPVGEQQYVAWGLMIFGWILSIALVAGVTKALSKS